MMANTYVNVNWLRLWRWHIEKAFDPNKKKKEKKKNKIAET